MVQTDRRGTVSLSDRYPMRQQQVSSRVKRTERSTDSKLSCPVGRVAEFRHPGEVSGCSHALPSVLDAVDVDPQVLRAAEHWTAPVGRWVFDQPGVLYSADEVLEREVDLQACQRPPYT